MDFVRAYLVPGSPLYAGAESARAAAQVLLDAARLARIPVVRAIYSASKQLAETLFSGQGKSFRKVVMVRYPHAGTWALAFVTGDGLVEASARTGRDLVNVFVPTTPNPTSGFFIMVPREEMIELEMSVDTGIRLILSAGAVVPVDNTRPVAPDA